MQASPKTVGDHVRTWRTRRRLSQLHFALDAEVSQRHLSFIESNRATPSRDMILRIAEHLDVPLRDRNAMLLAAGYAPQFRERQLDDPTLKAARAAIDLILKGHEPYPAIAVDRHWTLLAANGAVAPLLDLVSDSTLLKPPINVLRLSLHPGGLAPHIRNFTEWRHHLLDRLRRQIDVSADPVLQRLSGELQALPQPSEVQGGTGNHGVDDASVMVPLQLATPFGVLNFFSTITVFGSPVEITLSEIALEAFYPADTETAEALRRVRT
ncbi:MAG: helix-turn-helix transcriptional regulator [Rhizobiales bacterium]|nr:helix-turn-helix transcriptional regulator [Hyphomicrobiales bacterium]